MKKVIKKLKGRPLELLIEVGKDVDHAQQNYQMAEGIFRNAMRGFEQVMEMATGDDDPASLLLDPETGEVTRELPDIPKTPAKPRGKARGAKPKKPVKKDVKKTNGKV